jgi:hypothetical protein
MTPHAEIVSLPPPPPAPALSLVPQINEAYAECVAAEGRALPYAIRCGELLNTAREAVTKDWLAWLAEHCPGIHQTTANDYMRLAKHQTMFKGTALSIRGALKQIPKAPPRENKKENKKNKSGAANAIENAMKDEEAGTEMPTDESLRNLGPDEMFKTLIVEWDTPNLVALTDLLVAHLKEHAT